MSLRVLLIDDDRRLYEVLSEYLDDHGVSLVHAPDGPRGLEQLSRDVFDAVLLDIMMPGPDGLEVLRQIRMNEKLPVIMLTARGDESDRVVGLELGADDYIHKPFSARELVARLRAVLRRAQPEAAGEQLRVSGIEVDVPARRVRVRGEQIELTGLELDILVALMRRAGRVVPRSSLLDAAGRAEVVSDRAVDVHISHLRKKLGGDAPIRTVRGVGYVFSREDT
ncbi:MAG TPA: response regulator transcription factor [Polyangiaceae bacterium]|nr:response regulator transcription factor [Polyangiaceae bacterium]HMR74252.1 response regulator transcription factor [Polyangiaceae bacterium]